MNGGRAGTPALRASERIFGVDVARGLALLGMFVAHTVVGGGEKLVDGRSSILFATVAGVSLGLLTGGAAPPASGRGELRAAIAVRGLVLVIVGALLGLLDPPLAVILDSYGVAFVVLVPALFLPRVVLLALALLGALAAPPIVAGVTGAVDLAEVPPGLVPFATWFTHGTYPMLIWFAFFLTGLAAARSDVARVRTSLALLVGGAVASLVGYGLAWWVPGVTAEAHSGTTAEVLGSGGFACAVLGAAVLAGRVPGRAGTAVRGLLGPVAAAGGMVFTLYVAHVLVLAAIDDPREPGSYDAWVLPALLVGALAIGTVWRRFVGPGPLEAGMRAVSGLTVRRDA